MSFEDQLSDLTTPPPSADPVGKVLARAKRDRRRRAWVAVGAVTAVVVAVPLVLSSATTEHRSVPAATVTVPWALRPAGTPSGAFPSESETAGLPSCELGELTVGKAVAAPDGGGVTVPITLTNTGPECALHVDIAQVVIRDESGAVEPLGPNVGTAGVGHVPVRMAHGEKVGSSVNWFSNCGTEAGRWRLRLTYGGAALDGQVAEGSAVPTCEDQVQRQTVYGLADLTVVNDLGQPRDHPQSALESSYTADTSVAIGGVLHVALTVTNPTRGDISLTPCPEFVFSFAKTGRGSFFSASPSWLLNCPQAPDAIAPGQQVVFQIELPVSSALADGGVQPGTWFVSVSVGTTHQDPLPVTVTAASDPTTPASVDCGFPRVPRAGDDWSAPSSTVTTAGLPKQGVIETSKGPLTVAFDDRSPCAVTALLDLGRQGFWDRRPLSEISDGRFPSLTWRTGGEDANGYLLPPEVRLGTTYPAGTVLVYENQGGYSSFSSLQIAYDDLPYPPEFTPIGRITKGLDVVRTAAAAGPRGAKDLTITGVRAGT